VPFDLSMGEILVVLFVALLVFGGKLPETARKLGSALSEFKRGMREEMRKVEQGIRVDEPPPDWRSPKSAATEEIAREPAAAREAAPLEGPAAEPSRRDP